MHRYECFAVKARGYSHIESGTVCQDSAKCISGGGIVVIAVADGHGSPQYFRSDRGSEFASGCALDKLCEFARTVPPDFTDTTEEVNGRVSQLVKSIITGWQKCVKTDMEKAPFEAAELEKVPEKYALEYKNGVSPERAYGSTLIAAADCGEYLIGLQIGDGKCVAVYEDGSADEPIPWDERCHLNRCTSICDPKAAEEFRYYIWKEKLPAAVIICSDGIDDSYGTLLHCFCKSLLLKLTEGDFAEKAEEFQNELPVISKNGSKDDVSAAGMVDVSRIKNIRTILEADIKIAHTEKEISAAESKKGDLEFLCLKAERIYEKLRIAGGDEAEILDRQNKLLNLKKELEETALFAEGLKKKRDELLSYRENCVNGSHTVLCCPECGHKINVRIDTN
ncbi:MAG: protein phosphatase 2C domain-containing protein [Ruminococcus sp.]|nr:protein phosphatase 2C domain-containing protein [Ruminococcus sp.]